MDLRNWVCMLAWAPALLSCEGERGEGRLRIMLSAEASISQGLQLGNQAENVRDYPVRFSKYLVALGKVALARSRDDRAVHQDDVHVVDMMQVGAEGVELELLENLPAGQWDKFGFETPAASPEALRHEGVSQADYDEMVARGDSYWIEGSVLRPDALGGAVTFQIRAAVPSVFSECEHDGEPGVSVVSDGSATATITLHGDHIFFNGFTTGSEGYIERLSGYIVEADRDDDGHVGNDELAALDATDAFLRTRGYSLDGAPIVIETAFDFVRAQLASQGHYQGEGECIFSLPEAAD